MDALLRDIRYAVRSLRRTPGFTAAALLTLALGIGATSAIFTIVDAALLKPLPYPEPHRLFVLAPPGRSLTGQLFLHVRERARMFERLAAQAGGGGRHLVADGFRDYVATQRISEAFFETHGVDLLIGRGFSRAEDQPRGPDAVILSEALWRRGFDGAPSALGRTILLGDVPHVVVGIAPGTFRSIPDADLWTPLRTTPSDNGANYRVIGRVRDGATPAQAARELDGMRAGIRAEYPRYGEREIGSLRWTPYRDHVGSSMRQMLWLLLGAVLFLLLIACVNVAGLQLTRALSRRREVAVRMALGGSRFRVARLALVESLLLAACGAAAGLAVGLAATRLLTGLVSPQLAEQLLSGETIELDWRVLAFTAVVAVASGVIFGVAPAWISTGGNLRKTMLEGLTSTSSRRTTWVRRSLAGSELALACILLVGAGLLVRTFVNLTSTDLGFNPSGVLVGRMSLQGAIDPGTLESLLARGVERLGGIPGVVSVSASNGVPVERALNLPLLPPEGAVVSDRRSVDWRYVTPGYFAVFDIRPVHGRLFDDRDTVNAPPVAIVNEAFARAYFGRLDVVGRTIGLAVGPERPVQIVGVVRDAKARSGSGWTGGLTALGSATAPTMFEPAGQAAAVLPGSSGRVFDLTWAIRSSPARPEIERDVEAAVGAIDSRLTFISFEPMDVVVARDLDVPRFAANLFAGFGLLAVVLAAVGLYGLMAYTTSRRAREIGIRLALGSTGAHVARHFLREGLLIAAAGMLVGFVGAALTTRALAVLLFGVTPLDAGTFAAVSAVLLVVGGVATGIPAVRAARTDPVRVLRTE